MSIRSATLADIPSLLPQIAKICALHQQWDPAKYGFLPHPERRYEKWLGRLIEDSRHLCLVVEVSPSAEIAGFLLATVEQEVPIYHLKEFGFIHDLWVEEAYRHQGIARELVEAAIAHFKQVGVEQIRLDTAIVNENARRLFTACGFRASTVEMLITLT